MIPPWYRENAFIAWSIFAGTLTFLMFLAWSAYRFRIRHLEGIQAMQSEFSRALMQSQEDERKRIASDLHDSLGQDLVLIKNSAELAALKLNSDPSGSESPTLARLSTVNSLASHAIGEVRAITEDLRPPVLDRLGLAAAVESMIEKVSESSDAQFECKVSALDRGVKNEDEIAVFRMIQECLNNIFKHAEATKIDIAARRVDDTLIVAIRDNGKGFNLSESSKPDRRIGLGLNGLKERAGSVGGSIQIESDPGKGTSITISVPIIDDE